MKLDFKEWLIIVLLLMCLISWVLTLYIGLFLGRGYDKGCNDTYSKVFGVAEKTRR